VMKFDSERMILEDITDKSLDESAWMAYHDSLEFLISPIVFGTDIALTRMLPLIALQDEINASIKERLGLTE